MGTDGETRGKLLDSAKKEVLEKGYTKASLRKICADAGVTTGALYFFFKDKEALFSAIVEKPLLELCQLIQIHFSEDSEFAENSDFVHKEGDHDAIVSFLIHHLYANYEAFHLVLTKSQGSYYENFVDRIVEMTERHYLRIAEKMAAKANGMKVNHYMTHWLTHMHIDAFIHLLTHEPDEVNAHRQMKKIMDFLVNGFASLVLIPDEK